MGRQRHEHTDQIDQHDRVPEHEAQDKMETAAQPARDAPPPFRSKTAIAASTAAASERAILQTTLPVTGETLSKYFPERGATNLPPMKLS